MTIVINYLLKQIPLSKTLLFFILDVLTSFFKFQFSLKSRLNFLKFLLCNLSKKNDTTINKLHKTQSKLSLLILKLKIPNLYFIRKFNLFIL